MAGSNLVNKFWNFFGVEQEEEEEEIDNELEYEQEED